MKKPAEAGLREWVEQTVMLLEQDGLPRMAGRIFGWLLVCDPPEQSMEELAAAVQGSKASMSTMTRLLVQSGLVEKVRPPGARRDAFRVQPGQLGEALALAPRCWSSRPRRWPSRGWTLLAGKAARGAGAAGGAPPPVPLLLRRFPEMLEQPGAGAARGGGARPSPRARHGAGARRGDIT